MTMISLFLLGLWLIRYAEPVILVACTLSLYI